MSSKSIPVTSRTRSKWREAMSFCGDSKRRKTPEETAQVRILIEKSDDELRVQDGSNLQPGIIWLSSDDDNDEEEDSDDDDSVGVSDDDLLNTSGEDNLDSNISEENLILKEENEENFLPHKFTFGVEEEIIPEKMEFEKEMDYLWSEMHSSMVFEFGSTSTLSSMVENEVVNVSESEHDRTTLSRCRQEGHHLVLNEEVGMKCKFCFPTDGYQRYVTTFLSLGDLGGRHGIRATLEVAMASERPVGCFAKVAMHVPTRWASEAIRPRPSESIRCHPRASEAIRTSYVRASEGIRASYARESEGNRARVGRPEYMATYKVVRFPSHGCPRIPSHSSLGCPRMPSHSSFGWPRSDGLGCPACWGVHGDLCEDSNRDIPDIDHSANIECTMWGIIPDLKLFLQTYLNEYPSFRLVIVAPRNTLLTWETEFRKWKIDIPLHNLNSENIFWQGKPVSTVFLIKIDLLSDAW
ncbi:hypothetical protein F3Y22_tig00110328pilonHSYRG00744 [Hibiscus syriacus]|uniref:SNF2 N-terminal domain-containing protein n=1 Tax=Hibiscus syriacus TaxID=106335 RepID=A0A6A3B2N1_HIBSY|nr:hypothetical protein F3Y22_tig00110328pilonHSYRG00744 [Hibiscus syriacus]